MDWQRMRLLLLYWGAGEDYSTLILWSGICYGCYDLHHLRSQLHLKRVLPTFESEKDIFLIMFCACCTAADTTPIESVAAPAPIPIKEGPEAATGSPRTRYGREGTGCCLCHLPIPPAGRIHKGHRGEIEASGLGLLQICSAHGEACETGRVCRGGGCAASVGAEKMRRRGDEGRFEGCHGPVGEGCAIFETTVSHTWRTTKKLVTPPPSVELTQEQRAAQCDITGKAYTSDVDKKLSFLNSRRASDEPDSMQGLSRDLDAVKYDVGELKEGQARGRLRGFDFTAAMDAVNVDLDEMRARVDSTHSIITSRQRVEATVTAEISTMRLDMGDMQEALKAHDAWMEDVSQSLQEVHERCEYLNMEISGVNQNFQAKLDAKTDIASWNDMSLDSGDGEMRHAPKEKKTNMHGKRDDKPLDFGSALLTHENDDIDASIRTVRDMASSLRLEVDSRRRRVDEDLLRMRSEVSSLDEKVGVTRLSLHPLVN
eukprot:s344_g30.t1